MDIFHIYCNTSGNSGLYLDEIYQSLESEFKQMIFVNYYYPFKKENIKNIFFRLTEKNETNRYSKFIKGKCRKLVRVIELLYANFIILYFIRKERPKIINYSLTNMPFVKSYIKIIKIISPQSKIIITCHDVVPFESSKHIPYKDIYDLADFLLVHNNNSIKLLLDVYNQKIEKIYMHKFPMMDLSKLAKLDKEKKNDNNIKFLFIGYIREEKGVDVLIDAWEMIGDIKDAKLTIAGYLATNKNINFEKISEFDNVKLILKNLSDKEYIELISNSDYVIFPYKKVGNSGVLSTVISLDKIPITSNLPVFLESKYVDSKLTFEANNATKLKDKLIKILNVGEKEKNMYIKNIQDIRLQDNKLFKKEVNDIYNQLLKIESKNI